jgi:hypothetical protein
MLGPASLVRGKLRTSPFSVDRPDCTIPHRYMSEQCNVQLHKGQEAQVNTKELTHKVAILTLQTTARKVPCT